MAILRVIYIETFEWLSPKQKLMQTSFPNQIFLSGLFSFLAVDGPFKCVRNIPSPRPYRPRIWSLRAALA